MVSRDERTMNGRQHESYLRRNESKFAMRRVGMMRAWRINLCSISIAAPEMRRYRPPMPSALETWVSG